MVLDYLQVPFQYPRLVRLLRTQAFGTVFSNIRYLESLGLSVLIELGEVETLRWHLARGLPPIVYVDTGQLRTYWNEANNHAVVVTGIEGNQVYLNDPFFATAPQVITLAEFELAWLEQKQLYAAVGLDKVEKKT